jgi:hypothetical protein
MPGGWRHLFSKVSILLYVYILIYAYVLIYTCISIYVYILIYAYAWRMTAPSLKSSLYKWVLHRVTILGLWRLRKCVRRRWSAGQCVSVVVIGALEERVCQPGAGGGWGGAAGNARACAVCPLWVHGPSGAANLLCRYLELRGSRGAMSTSWYL